MRQGKGVAQKAASFQDAVPVPFQGFTTTSARWPRLFSNGGWSNAIHPTHRLKFLRRQLRKADPLQVFVGVIIKFRKAGRIRSIAARYHNDRSLPGTGK